MRLIADGEVDRIGVTGLAARLGYTVRQLERLLQVEVGAGPLALARAQRAQTARILIEETDLPFGDVAFAAGFASIRQFNDTVGEVLETTPTALRGRAARRSRRESPARRERCRYACRCERHSRTRVCSVIRRPPRCPVAKRSVPARTGVRYDLHPAAESSA
jgi:AraC-like DNA-binding protein